MEGSVNMNRALQKGQQGVVLIEALIGILIFSIGILALIGLQAVAIKNTVDSQNRIEAGFLANEIVSRMWTTGGDPTTFTPNFDVGTNTFRFTSGTSTNATLQAWLTKVANTMPGVNTTAYTNSAGTGTSPSIVRANRQVTITIYWKAPGEATIRNHQLVSEINSATN